MIYSIPHLPFRPSAPTARVYHDEACPGGKGGREGAPVLITYGNLPIIFGESDRCEIRLCHIGSDQL